MKFRPVAILLVIVSSRAYFGCSTESVVGPVNDGGTSEATASDASPPVEELDAAADDRPVTCNDVTQQGTPVSVINTQAPAPVGQGGVIADGTWVLTAAKSWGSSAQEGSSAGKAAAQTWLVHGSMVDIVSTTSATKAVTRSSGTITLAATEITLKQTCAYPAAAGLGAATTPFSATATTLRMYTSNGPTTLELTYSKQ